MRGASLQWERVLRPERYAGYAQTLSFLDTLLVLREAFLSVQPFNGFRIGPEEPMLNSHTAQVPFDVPDVFSVDEMLLVQRTDDRLLEFRAAGLARLPNQAVRPRRLADHHIRGRLRQARVDEPLLHHRLDLRESARPEFLRHSLEFGDGLVRQGWVELWCAFSSGSTRGGNFPRK